jgi:hypothetical protein
MTFVETLEIDEAHLFNELCGFMNRASEEPNESKSKLYPCGLEDTASRRDRRYRFLGSNDLGPFVDPTFSPSQSA